MRKSRFKFWWVKGLSLALLVACGDSEAPESDSQSGPAVCAPTASFPYPSTVPYVGVHAGPANNDVVPCETAEDFTQTWHALQGHAVAQPNTFSPDGQVIYVTTSQPDEGACNVWALNAVDGSMRWCESLAPGALWSAVEVDEEGDLYLTTSAGLTSLRADGTLRWETNTPEGPVADLSNGAIGLHFTPQGHIATVTDQGQVLLLRRSDGVLLATLDVPEAFGVERPAPVEGGVDMGSLLPPAVVADFQSLQYGSPTTLLAVFAGAANFSDNTIGVAPDGRLYIMGGGTETGGLFQVEVSGTEEQPLLSAGWMMPTEKGSASSPAISPDGRYVKVSDGNGTLGFLSPSEANAKTRIADIEACDANNDSQADPKLCGEAFVIPLLTGPTMGTTPMLNEGLHYQYEVQVAELLNTTAADVRAFQGETLLWERVLPDDLQWTSVITVTEGHLVGTGTRFTDSGESLLTVELPGTASSELLVLDRADGSVVFRAPITDDSTSTVSVGPDGSLYVTMLCLMHMLAEDTRPVGGVIRFSPTE